MMRMNPASRTNIFNASHETAEQLNPKQADYAVNSTTNVSIARSNVTWLVFAATSISKSL